MIFNDPFTIGIEKNKKCMFGIILFGILKSLLRLKKLEFS